MKERFHQNVASQAEKYNSVKRLPTAQETSRQHILKPAPTDKNTDMGKTTKATGETSKRGGRKLEGQEINLPRAEKQQHRETTALLNSRGRNSCRWRSEDVSRQNHGRQKRLFIGKDKE